MGDPGRKRSRDEYEEDLTSDSPLIKDAGAAGTLTHMHEPQQNDQTDHRHQDNGGEWAEVRPSKRSRYRGKASRDTKDAKREGKAQAGSNSRNGREKEKEARKAKGREDNRPTLNVAAFHKIHSGLKIGDLQALALYCLADGPSPQWISARHHLQIRKVVILMVPGLERAMFSGDIELRDEQEDGGLQDNVFSGPTAEKLMEIGAQSDEMDERHLNGSKSRDSGPSSAIPIPKRNPLIRNPDNFLPTELAEKDLPSPLKPLACVFPHLWPVKCPGDDKYDKVHSPLHAMLNAPLTRSKEESAGKGPKTPVAGRNWENKRTPITSYITSADDLRESNYVLHSLFFDTDAEREIEALRRKEARNAVDDGWVESHVKSLAEAEVPDEEIQSGSMTQGREIIAVDCEMVVVSDGTLALARISLVSWDGSVIMDELVKPDLPIKDYVTPYSGMTPAKLDPITTTLSDIQQRLLSLFKPTTILVGHSLEADLAAIKISHPFIVDTSILYPHPRGPPLKSSLKWLAQKYLNRAIQQGHGATGHDSIEDARAALDLVKVKCEKGPDWGTSEAAGESIFKRLGRSHVAGKAVTGAIVDRGNPEKGFGHSTDVCIGCESDEAVVEGVIRAIKGDPDGKVVKGGGMNFVWGRLRDLERKRGWSNEYRQAAMASKPGLGDILTTNGTAASDEVEKQTPGDALLHPPPDPSSTELAAAVKSTCENIKAIHDALPPCTMFIVYSGTGDPRPMAKYHEIRRRFQAEYKIKKWDELTYKWGDVEEQGLKVACRKARDGVGFVCLT